MGYIHGGSVINGSLSSSQADHQIANKKKKEEDMNQAHLSQAVIKPL